MSNNFGHLDDGLGPLEEDNPDKLADCFDEGWAAGYHDEPPDNPYPKGSLEAVNWQKGYEEGSWNS
jgi:hypothetical protein